MVDRIMVLRKLELIRLMYSQLNNFFEEIKCHMPGVTIQFDFQFFQLFVSHQPILKIRFVNSKNKL